MSLNRDKVPIALTIAGFDGSGGAGILADIKTFHSFNCYGLAVTTAITIQNTLGVIETIPLAATVVSDQLKVLFDDIEIDVIKIGMLANKEITIATSDFLLAKEKKTIVLDTPIYSSSGHRLLSTYAEKIVCEKLFPLATLITPNLAEASILSGKSVNDLATMQEAAVKLHAMGAAAVLIKGGHLPHQAIDLFYDGTKFETFSSAHISNIEVHGTGCTLSSAIAALLAQGHSLLEAIFQAKTFITQAILSAQPLGKGARLLIHSHN